MSRIKANLVLLLAAAIWGGGFVAQSTAMDTIGPFWFVGLRFAIAAIAVLPFAVMEQKRLGSAPNANDLRAFLLVGLALFGGAITQQIGLQTTTVTNSSFLTGLYVVFVPILSILLFRRAPHWVIWPVAILALIGIFLLGGATVETISTGDLWSIACAAFWGLQIVLAGHVMSRSPRPLALSVTQFATCAVLSLAVGLMLAEPISMQAISASLAEILYVGLISSGLAFVLQVIGQRYTTAPQAAIFLSSEALFGAFFGAILLGETLPSIGYVGCGLIFIAMLTVEILPELLSRRRQHA
ncbi:DMT family transporter [Rhizobium sp. FY34]|uniref:DMT family transporter n=1 Tax=Rhizobium sp. FY34 TaxID=2562309 RepID=UPI0010C03231|nr:DMT family transporter [Rhizobium sp. FY34]